MAKDDSSGSDVSGSVSCSSTGNEGGCFAQDPHTNLPSFVHVGNPAILDQQQIALSGALGNIAGANLTSSSQPNIQGPSSLAPLIQEQLQQHFPSQQGYRPVVRNPNQQIRVGVVPPTARKKTKRSTRPEAEITARPPSEQGQFAKARKHRQQLREKHHPLAQHDPNIMTKRTASLAKSKKAKAAAKAAASSAKVLKYHGELYEMPETKEELESVVTQIMPELEEANKNNVELEATIVKLKARLEELIQMMPKLAVNPDMVLKIREKIKLYIFRTCKFLGDDNHIALILETLYDLIFDKEEQDEHGKDHQQLWMTTYHSTLTAELNAHRSYVQNRMKDSWKKFHEAQGYLPTVQEIDSCAMRTINLDDKRGFAIMEWYALDMLSKCHVVFSILTIIVMPGPTLRLFSSFFLCCLLPKGKVVGHKNWPATAGLHVELSKAKSLDGKKLFMTSTEAFVVTIFDSNHNKWSNMFKLYADNGNYNSLKLPAKITKEEKQKDPTLVDPYHDAKYTRQDGGQLELGSFSDEGMDYYAQVGEKIREQRTKMKKEIAEYEAKLLQKLREKHNVADNNGKKKGKAARKSGDGAAKPTKKRKIIFLDDDE